MLVGKYRLLSVLGQGGMGTVWRAEHIGLGAPVAVKLIDPKLQSSPEAFRQCQKEARAAAALRSPHVVQVLDFGMDDVTGSPFIVMELLEGESLADRLRRTGALSPADTARVVTHVARALSRAHEVGIIHRDLKPANVFLVRNEDDEMAKVLDFGTARVQPSGTLGETTTPTGLVVGTPYYMSPEHITGNRIDHRTDLWALGVMVCECLVGRRPFDATEIGQLVLQICTYPIVRPSELGAVPPGLDDWFARVTERDPARRFQSARELADDLRRVCAEPARGPSPRRALPPTMVMTPPTTPVGPVTIQMSPPTAPQPAPSAAAPFARPTRSTRVVGGAVLMAGVVAAIWLIRGAAPPAPAPAVAPEAPPAAVAPSSPVPPPPAPAPPAPAPAPAPLGPAATPASQARAETSATKGVRKRRRRGAVAAPAPPAPSTPSAPSEPSEPRHTPPSLESVLDQRR